MKLTVLGRYAPLPAPGGACSSYLLTAGAASVLIDGGNGAAARLLERVSLAELTAVVVSHLHPDHYSDLHCLRYGVRAALEDGRRKAPLPVYAPGEPDLGVRWLEAEGLIDLRPLDPAGLEIGGLKFSFARTRHPIPCYALAVESGGARLFYSADTATSDEVFSLATGADLALVEASLREVDSERRDLGHLTAAEAASLARAAGVKRALLTHLWPEYDLAGLLAEAREAWPEAELAQEGAEYSV